LIPIAAGLRPYLAEAMLSARGEYVFPDDEAKMRPRQTKLRTVLARALRRAGLVAGYSHVCRRNGRSHYEARPRTAAGAATGGG